MDIRFFTSVGRVYDDGGNIVNIALLTEARACSSAEESTIRDSVEYFGKKGHKSVIKFSDVLTKRLREYWHYKDRFDLVFTYERTLFFHLRFYLNRWLVYLYIIDRAIKKHSPGRIYIDRFSSESDSLSLIVKAYIESNKLANIKIILENEASSANANANTNTNTNTNANVAVPNFKYIRFFNFLMVLVLRIRRTFTKNKRALLIADDSYNMPNLVEQITKNKSDLFPIYLNISMRRFWDHAKNALMGKELFFLHGGQSFSGKVDDSHLKKHLRLFSKKIESRQSASKEFVFLGVNLKNTLLDYVNNLAPMHMAHLENCTKEIHSIVRISSPRLSLSQHALGYSYALGEICSMSSIPGLLVTHGTHAPQEGDKYAKLEWSEHAKTIFNSHFSHTAIQSPMAGDFFQSLDDTYSIALKTGPLLFARAEANPDSSKQDLIGVEHANKKIILHAGTPKSYNSMRPWVYETNDEYIRNINDLIKVVDQLENTYLVIRFRPSEGLSRETFLQLIRHSDHCGVYSAGCFSDYLSIADVLVSYSSTTIEEALQNNRPVLQYDHDNKYMHIKAPSIDRQVFDINPIYYCGSSDNLLKSIRFILENTDLIQVDQSKWKSYRYTVDAELSWLNELYKYDQFKPIQ